MTTWKRDAASGLIVVVPILVSVYVVGWLYWRLAGIPVPGAIPEPAKVAVLLLVFAAGVMSIGFLMRSALGSIVERWVDKAVNQLPLIRVVYNASKMAVETALSGTDDLQTPVKLEPWDGLRMTAFKTGKTASDGRDVLFLPTAPNITSGYVIEVESDEYEEIDESVEDALTRILSAGFGDTEVKGTTIPVAEESPEGSGRETEDRPAPDATE